MLIKPEDLQSRVIHAKTIRVEHLNCLYVSMSLEFGVKLERKLVIEGINQNDIPTRLRQKAKKAMVVLVGGKNLLVHTADNNTTDGIIKSRLFLNEKVYAPPEECAMTPYGCDEDLLEIGTFFQWLRTKDFDIGALKEVLNGTRRSGTP